MNNIVGMEHYFSIINQIIMQSAILIIWIYLINTLFHDQMTLLSFNHQNPSFTKATYNVQNESPPVYCQDYKNFPSGP